MNQMSLIAGHDPAFSRLSARDVPLGRLRYEIDRLFEDYGPPHSLFECSSRSAAMPAIELIHSMDGYLLTAELPGMKRPDVDIRVGGSIISISGEKRCGTDAHGLGALLSERHYGAFERRFQLPDDVDPDGVAASMTDGLLTVFMPRRVGREPIQRKVDIAEC